VISTENWRPSLEPLLHADRRTRHAGREGCHGAPLPEAITAKELAGEPILAKLSTAPGNGAPIGGLKVVTASGWFAARPSGTENIYKVYAESFRDQAHLDLIVQEAQLVVSRTLADMEHS